MTQEKGNIMLMSWQTAAWVKQRRGTRRLIAALGIVSCTGCSVIGSDHTGPWDDGYIHVSGDARGMRAFGDALNGLVVTGKASPDKDTAYHYNRRAEDQEITKREAVRKAPQGFIQKLFAGNPEETPK